MDFCPTVDMIRYYLTKAQQVYQFCQFGNIILGIHEYDIPSYNSSRKSYIEGQKIKLDKDKEEAQKSVKLSGDKGN